MHMNSSCADAASGWLCRALSFAARLNEKGAGGRIEHFELSYGDGGIMIA